MARRIQADLKLSNAKLLNVKLLNAFDMSRMNFKIYRFYISKRCRVKFDVYRLGRVSREYEEIIRAAIMGEVKAGISPCDFYLFPLELLVEFLQNRRAACPHTLPYYHPRTKEIEVFQNYIFTQLQQDVERAVEKMLHNDRDLFTTKEFNIDYKTI